MAYDLEVSKEADKKFYKLSKKNSELLEAVEKKMKQILINSYHFKPIRGNMRNIRGIHIGKSFVLTYEIMETENIVGILNFDHHDKIYRK